MHGIQILVTACITCYIESMRTIVNISLPPDVSSMVHKEVRLGGYASVSEFFRHLLRNHKLADELRADRGKFEAGKGKVLHSLRDLR